MYESYTLILDKLEDFYYNELLKYVSPEKRNKISRYHFSKDAQMSLLGDILIRTLACEHLKISNTEIFILCNAYGKPYLAEYDHFHFNISHCGKEENQYKYIAGAVSNQPIGIDIEMLNVDHHDIIRSFSDQEKEYILMQPPADQGYDFIRVWTMKESYIKYMGKGLSIPLDSFSVLDSKNKHKFFQIFENDDVICNICSPIELKHNHTVINVNEFCEKAFAILDR